MVILFPDQIAPDNVIPSGFLILFFNSTVISSLRDFPRTQITDIQLLTKPSKMKFEPAARVTH